MLGLKFFVNLMLVLVLGTCNISTVSIDKMISTSFLHPEILDTTTEALFWKPTEAPGAAYIGSSALFIVIAEFIFVVLVDLSNYKASLRFVQYMIIVMF